MVRLGLHLILRRPLISRLSSLGTDHGRRKLGIERSSDTSADIKDDSLPIKYHIFGDIRQSVVASLGIAQSSMTSVCIIQSRHGIGAGIISDCQTTFVTPALHRNDGSDDWYRLVWQDAGSTLDATSWQANMQVIWNSPPPHDSGARWKVMQLFW